MKAKLRIMLLCGKTERLGFSWILLWSAGRLRMAWAGLGRLAGDRTLRKIVSKAQKKYCARVIVRAGMIQNRHCSRLFLSRQPSTTKCSESPLTMIVSTDATLKVFSCYK